MSSQGEDKTINYCIINNVKAPKSLHLIKQSQVKYKERSRDKL